MRFFSLTSLIFIALSAYGQPAIKTPETLPDSFFSAISGPAGARDWGKIQAMFLPEARLDAVRYKEGNAMVRQGTFADYKANTDAFFKKRAFVQKGMEKKVFLYDQMAQVICKYETTIRYSVEKKTVSHGIACFQMLKNNGQWQIAAITWNDWNEALGELPVLHQTDAADSTTAPVVIPEQMKYEIGVEGPIYMENEVDSMAQFKGGNPAIFEFLGRYMETPADPVEAALSATFKLEFVVDHNGYISNVKSPDAPGPGWHLSAAQALMSMPRWIPAKKNGQAVNCRATLVLRVNN